MQGIRGKRYDLVPPIPNGEQFWLIVDKQTNMTLVTISVRVNECERIAAVMYHHIAGE